MAKRIGVVVRIKPIVPPNRRPADPIHKISTCLFFFVAKSENNVRRKIFRVKESLRALSKNQQRLFLQGRASPCRSSQYESIKVLVADIQANEN